MRVVETRVDAGSAAFGENREAYRALVDTLRERMR